MITDIRALAPGSVIESDLCIVGGGPAAIAVALELAGSRVSISVLESGGLTLDKEAQGLAAGQQSGIRYFELNATRHRVFGGSTIVWGARTSPFKPVDFARRNWVPLSGWPLALDALSPHYDRVYEIIGLHRPFSFDDDVWSRFAMTPPPVDRRLLQFCAFQFGKNLLMGEVYRKPLREAGNVTVYLNATALNVQSTERADHVAHIDVAAPGGHRYTFKASNYVLACGGLENARLLLLSNSVNPAGLCNERDVVGRYFMEHPTVTAGTVVSNAPQELLDVFSPGLVKGRLVEVGLALSPELQESQRCLNGVVRLTPVAVRDSTQALRELLWNLQHRSKPTNLWAQLGIAARDPFGIIANVVRHAAGRPKRFRSEAVRLEVRTEQAPNPESRVKLSDDIDAFGQRRAHLQWVMTTLDKRTMRIAAETFAAEIRRLGLGELKMESRLTTDELEWPAGMVGGHHHMGTTRMSTDSKTGIVDSNCRTHAVDNLYVAGSSVFPTAGYANPTATLLALSVRLAAHLKALRA